MIKEDKPVNEWYIYSATQFSLEFNIKEAWDSSESDEDYIMRHLEADGRLFRIVFMESARNNSYEEYWKIEEVQE